jgi:hypothetical protein
MVDVSYWQEFMTVVFLVLAAVSLILLVREAFLWVVQWFALRAMMREECDREDSKNKA